MSKVALKIESLQCFLTTKRKFLINIISLIKIIISASLSDKLFIDKETIQASPLTTDISIGYDTATPERPPRIGINFNLTM